MNYFGMSYDQVVREIPYPLLVMLSASVPKYNAEKENENPQGGEHLFNLLGGTKK